MNLLLDTHILLWWLMDSPALKESSRKIITNSENIIFVSAASGWEIAIKKSIGKLHAPHDLITAITANNFEILPITIPHTEKLGELPYHHRDPFDHMLIAQAQYEQLKLMTDDEQIKQYDVSILL